MSAVGLESDESHGLPWGWGWRQYLLQHLRTQKSTRRSCIDLSGVAESPVRSLCVIALYLNAPVA